MFVLCERILHTNTQTHNHTNTQTHKHTNTNTQTHKHTNTHGQMRDNRVAHAWCGYAYRACLAHVQALTLTHTCKHARSHTRASTHTHTHVHALTLTHTCTHSHSHTRARTHAHTHAWPDAGQSSSTRVVSISVICGRCEQVPRRQIYPGMCVHVL